MSQMSLPAGRAIDVTVTLRRSDGVLLEAGREITVTQRRHPFLFGCTGFDAIALVNGEILGAEKARVERIYGHWFELFNAVTLPFYWGRFEPRRGSPDTQRLLAAARWFRDRGTTVKGHPLVWHTLAAPWLLKLPSAEVIAAQRARIRREVSGFAGVIDTWDVINEAVIMPRFDRQENGISRIAQQLGRLGTVRMAFEEARAANPGAFLLINDFDLSAEYEALIAECLDAGVTIDAIGIQSHMHQGYWGEERTREVLERFARFGLPLYWAETTLVSGHLMPPEIVDLNDYQVEDWPTTAEGEARQAEEAVRHYRTLFEHPSVAAITWWDPADGAWLNAPAGLLRKDGSPKPAFEALRGLIKGEWWLPPRQLTTDEGGRVRFRALPGTYALTDGTLQAEIEFKRSETVAATLLPTDAPGCPDARDRAARG